jgi:hypothetical protein
LHYASENSRTRTNTMKMAVKGEEGQEGETFTDVHLSFRDTEAVLSKVSKGEV